MPKQLAGHTHHMIESSSSLRGASFQLEATSIQDYVDGILEKRAPHRAGLHGDSCTALLAGPSPCNAYFLRSFSFLLTLGFPWFVKIQLSWIRTCGPPARIGGSLTFLMCDRGHLAHWKRLADANQVTRVLRVLVAVQEKSPPHESWPFRAGLAGRSLRPAFGRGDRVARVPWLQRAELTLGLSSL